MASITAIVRNLLDRPGGVNLTPYRKIVKAAGDRGDRIGGLDELPTPDMSDLAEFCAVAREAADRTLGLRPYDVQLLGHAGPAGRATSRRWPPARARRCPARMAAAGYALQGKRGARDDRQRLPGPARRRVDGAGLRGCWASPSAGSARRPRRRSGGRRTRSDVTYGLGQRGGLRLPARPAAHRRGATVVPAPERGADRRGRLGPDRRGPGAAGAGRGLRRGQTRCRRWRRWSRQLRRGYHYEIDDQARNVYLTTEGRRRPSRACSGVDLYDEHEPGTLIRGQPGPARARAAARDVDYIVRDGKVELIDEIARPGRAAAALARRAAGGGRGQGGAGRRATRARSSTRSPCRAWSRSTRRCAA